MTYKSVLDPRVVDNAVDMMRADPDVSLYDAILAQPNPDSQMWAGVSCIARIGRFETGNIKSLVMPVSSNKSTDRTGTRSKG